MQANRSEKAWGRMKRDGFSFVELLVALVLVAILSIAIMAMARDTHAEVVAEAGILRAHLRFAQGMAMANNTASWSVLVAGTSYTLQRNGTPSPVNWPGENSATRLMADSVQVVQGAGVYSFCQWGCPGGNVVIALSDGQHQEQISILGLTGLIQ